MKPFIFLLASLLTLWAISANAGRLIGVGSGGSFYRIDSRAGVYSHRVNLPLWVRDPGIQDVYSLAKHPGTNVIYGVVNATPNLLVTIEPSTGVFTFVAQIEGADRITTLTFGPAPDYPLFAIVGKESETVGTEPSGGIYTIDLATGQATGTGWTTSGVGGHALEFNPDDGMLYHFYSSEEGGEDPEGLEKIDPATGARTPVPLSGAAYGAVNAIVYGGSGLFYAHDQVDDQFLSISTAGAVSALAATSDRILALELMAGSILYAGASNRIFEVKPGTGDESNSVDYVSKPAARRLSSIARDPATGDHYVLTPPDHPDTGVNLAILNLETGALTGVVALSDPDVENITFGTGGQLYGVISPAASSNRRGIVAVIDKTTGQLTEQPWATTRGETHQELAYNPADGCLFHFWVEGITEQMEKIDPATGAVTPIALTPAPPALSGITYWGSGSFYGFDSENLGARFFRIASDGTTTDLGFKGQFPDFLSLRDFALLPLTAAERAWYRRLIRKFQRKIRKTRKQARRSQAKRKRSRPKIRRFKRKVRIQRIHLRCP